MTIDAGTMKPQTSSQLDLQQCFNMMGIISHIRGKLSFAAKGQLGSIWVPSSFLDDIGDDMFLWISGGQTCKSLDPSEKNIDKSHQCNELR